CCHGAASSHIQPSVAVQGADSAQGHDATAPDICQVLPVPMTCCQGVASVLSRCCRGAVEVLLVPMTCCQGAVQAAASAHDMLPACCWCPRHAASGATSAHGMLPACFHGAVGAHDTTPTCCQHRASGREQGMEGEGRIGATRAESQWIVAARPLCHLQYPVAYLESSAKDSTRRSVEIGIQGVPRDSSAARGSPTTRAFGGQKAPTAGRLTGGGRMRRF
ncbi:Regulator of rDNA transcription protein 15, partial [Quillaja saponaria]